MNKLKNKVVSLRLAKKMKTLGFKQDSLFYWIRMSDKRYKKRWYCTYYPSGETPANDVQVDRFCSAYISEEIGEMFPAGICQDRRTQKSKYGTEVVSLNICPKWQKGERRYVLYLAGCMFYTQSDKETDARAKMAIYLRTNKLI